MHKPKKLLYSILLRFQNGPSPERSENRLLNPSKPSLESFVVQGSLLDCDNDVSYLKRKNVTSSLTSTGYYEFK